MINPSCAFCLLYSFTKNKGLHDTIFTQHDRHIFEETVKIDYLSGDHATFKYMYSLKWPLSRQRKLIRVRILLIMTKSLLDCCIWHACCSWCDMSISNTHHSRSIYSVDPNIPFYFPLVNKYDEMIVSLQDTPPSYKGFWLKVKSMFESQWVRMLRWDSCIYFRTWISLSKLFFKAP